MERSDRKLFLRKITEVEQQIARLRKEQEEAEMKLSSLRARPAPGSESHT
jgi:hypothetical protein